MASEVIHQHLRPLIN